MPKEEQATPPPIRLAENKTQIRGDIANYLLRSKCFVSMISEEIFVYDSRSGIWREDLSEGIIRHRVQQVMGDSATRYDQNEVISAVRVGAFHGLERDHLFWEVTPKHLICLKNGVLDINTEELKEHSPEYHFLNRIPVEFIPRGDPRLEGKCVVRNFLGEVLGSEEDVRTFYELSGYCFYRDYHIQKACMLEGEGANGKSTALNLLKSLLGSENVSSISLRSLCSHRFSIANLRGKQANIYNELSVSSLKYTGLFKMLVGGDPIDTEKKFVQRNVSFVNHAKLIFSCNQAPKVESDDTTAFWRRWNIINFPNVFDDEHGNVDREILKKLTEPLELSAFLLDALDGLRRLLDQKRFSNYRKTSEIRDLYLLHSDPIKYFAEKNLTEDSESYEVKTVVYRAYKQFCKELSLVPVRHNTFSLNLKSYINFEDCRRTIKGKKSVTCYCGIKLVDKEDESEEDSEGLAPWVKESEMDMGKGASNLAIKQGESQKKAEESRINGSLPTFYRDEERFKVSTADTQIEETKHCIYCHEEVNEDEKPPDKIAINLDGKHKKVVVHLSCLRAHVRNSPKMCVFCGKLIVDPYEGNHGFYTAVLHDGRFAHTRCCDARRIGYTSDTGCHVTFAAHSSLSNTIPISNSDLEDS